jgi:hypothetical protein
MNGGKLTGCGTAQPQGEGFISELLTQDASFTSINHLLNPQGRPSPPVILTIFANSRGNHGFMVRGPECFQELRFGLRIAQT